MTLTLRDIAYIRLGYPFRERIKPSTSGDVSVVQMRDLTSAGCIDWTSCVRTRVDFKREPDWLHQEDIIFPTRGNVLRAVLVDQSCENFHALASSHLFVIRIKPSVSFLPDYIAWWLNQRLAQHYIRSCSQSSTIFTSLSAKLLGDVPIAPMRLEGQRKLMTCYQDIQRENSLLQRLVENNKKVFSSFASYKLQNMNI